MNEERRKATAIEVKLLLDAGFIVAIKCPKWLSNPVLVQKKNGTWRFCIDYTNLNAACPKDEFVLPRIDQIIDSTAGSESLCFLDAYSGYNQIKMAVDDQEKTAFTTPFGCYMYTAKKKGFDSTLLQSHTQKPMVKPSALIKASSMASSFVFKCHSNALQDAGQKKFQRYCGDSAPLSTGRLDILLSSWSTVQKQSLYPTSSTILRESSNMPKKKTSTPVKTASTYSTKNAT